MKIRRRSLEEMAQIVNRPMLPIVGKTSWGPGDFSAISVDHESYYLVRNWWRCCGIRGLWWEEEGVRAWICYSKGDVILQEVKPFDLSTKIEDLP